LSEENDDPGLKLQHKVNDGAWEDTPPYTGELGKPNWTDGGVKFRPQQPTHFTQVEQDYHYEPNDPAFKMHKLVCENCDSPLTVTDGKRLAFCAFCNAQYYLENFEPELEEFPAPSETSMSNLYCLDDPYRYSGASSGRTVIMRRAEEDAGGASTREILGKTGGWLDLEE
jgi:hypothetical protein